jgi:hypothetical protein
MTCLVDPCVGQHIMCKKGSCVLGVPVDAATDAPAPAKDAGSLDAAAKGASSAAPATSAAPKVSDASAASARD